MPNIKTLLCLIPMYVLLLIAGGILIPGFLTGLTRAHYFITLSYVFLVSEGLLFLFFRGLHKSRQKAVLNTFLTISIKFILYLVFIITYYLLTKNFTTAYLIVFFVLYLAFTSFVLIVMVKSLKTKHL